MTAPARPFVNSGGRPWLTRAARRDIRRAHAVASELKMHSFAVHGVVWTLKHDSMQGSSKKNNPNEPDSQKNESKPSRREQRASRSTQRAAAHHALMSRAQDHYARVLIRRWARSSADATEAAATDVAMTLESSPPTEPPQLPSSPATEQPSGSGEHKGTAGGASKRRAPFVEAASPSAPVHRDKRDHVLPTGPPPPSLPPSPPSSHPSPPHPPRASSPCKASSLTCDASSVAPHLTRVASSVARRGFMCKSCDDYFADWIYDTRRTLCRRCHECWASDSDCGSED